MDFLYGKFKVTRMVKPGTWNVVWSLRAGRGGICRGAHLAPPWAARSAPSWWAPASALREATHGQLSSTPRLTCLLESDGWMGDRAVYAMAEDHAIVPRGTTPLALQCATECGVGTREVTKEENHEGGHEGGRP